jgi:hypothetical protein
VEAISARAEKREGRFADLPPLPGKLGRD